jgi:hypothetical protein
VQRAIERANAMLNSTTLSNNVRLEPDYCVNTSDKTFQQWLKETDDQHQDDESSSSDEGDKGTRAPHTASAGKTKTTREPTPDNTDSQENKKAAEKAAEMAEAAVADKHGFDIDRTALNTVKPNAGDLRAHERTPQDP